MDKLYIPISIIRFLIRHFDSLKKKIKDFVFLTIYFVSLSLCLKEDLISHWRVLTFFITTTPTFLEISLI